MLAVIQLLLLSFLFFAPNVSAQTPRNLDSEQVWITTKTPSIFGGELQLRLEATLYKPQGSGPFPVAIVNHGSTGPGAIPERQTLRPDLYARILSQHGFASIAPMRRGRGASEGLYGESYLCDLGASEHGIENAVADVDAVVDYLKSVSFIDPTRIVMTGSSRGGLLSIVYAAQRPGTVLGVVNFVGGWMGTQCTNGINEASFKNAGARSKVPTLWLYAEDDNYYKNGAPAQYYSLYKEAGGVATFRLYPLTFGKNGHFLGGFPNVWRADFNRFMEDLGFPAKSSD